MAPTRTRIALAACAAAALVASACAELADLPKLRAKDLKGINLVESSRIYDSVGRLITTLHGEQDRTVVPLRSIPRRVQRAVIAIEDERFYEHEGVDLKAVVRAVFANATSGEIREGGSTITQQYVKNAFIAPEGGAEKTLERKIVEAALSRQLEKKVSKRWILERYLNTVYFGGGAYGIQAAAKTFFGKPARALSLAEGALLAGLIRAPEEYDPQDRRKLARARRNVVLDKMVELGWAKPRAARKAKRTKLNVRPGRRTEEYPAPYFLDYVQRLIKYDPRFKAVGKTLAQRRDRLFQGGLRIFTTVDLEAQAAAEQAIDEILYQGSDPYGALVAIEPDTGYVRAMVGGRDWFAPPAKDRFAKLNLATVAEPGLDCERNPKGRCVKPLVPGPAPGTGRQAGSAFKTFALVAALQQDVPLTKVYRGGRQIVFPGVGEYGEDYVVQNYEGTSYGNLSLLEATVNSVNVVYAQVIDEIGPQAVVDTAAAMGIRTPLLAVMSAALGTNEVNPLGMASGFGTLAAGGVHHPPVAITKIVDSDGRTIYEDDSEPVPAVEPADAYLATSALEQVIQRGTGTNAAIGRPAAGKTGTAQEYRDAWFVGYTPDLVASVWVGYPEGQIEMKPSCEGSESLCKPTRTITSGGVTGGSFPAQIWAAFMLRALSDVPATDFTAPSGIVTVEIDTRHGDCLASEDTPEEFRELRTFTGGTEPTQVCRGGAALIRVPDVFGFPEDEAVDVLRELGFQVTIREEVSSTYPPGRVIGQDPAAEDKALRGATVTVTVSSSAADTAAVYVPDVLGMTGRAARAALQREAFRVRVIVEAESAPGQARKRRGRVWKQQPARGTASSPGATVTIWVNPR